MSKKLNNNKISKVMFSILSIVFLISSLTTIGLADKKIDNKDFKDNFDYNYKYKHKFNDDKSDSNKNSQKKEKFEYVLISLNNKNQNLLNKYSHLLEKNGISIIEKINKNTSLIKTSSKSKKLFKKNFILLNKNNKKIKINFNSIQKFNGENKISNNFKTNSINNRTNFNQTHYLVYLELFNSNDLNFTISQLEKNQIESFELIPETNNLISIIPKESLTKIAKIDTIYSIRPVVGEPQSLINNAKFVTSSDNLEVNYDLTGSNINFMLYDNFLPWEHQDLNSRITYADDTENYNNHPTHISGILIGNGTLNQIYSGIAPKGKITAFQIDDEITEDNLFNVIEIDLYKNIKSGILDYDIDISSNPWGSSLYWNDNQRFYCDYGSKYLVTTQIIDNQAYKNKNTPFIFSSGNSQDLCKFQDTYKTLTPEATAKNAITVGATNFDNTIWEHSSLGPTDDGRLKPELVAPGCNDDSGFIFIEGIKSTVKTFLTKEDTYKAFCGTSISQAQVSGIVGLMMEEWNKNSSNKLLSSTYKSILIDTADDLDNSDSGNFKHDGPSFKSGYGLLNGSKAIERIGNYGFKEDIVSKNGKISYEINVTNSTEELKFTLSWTDKVQNKIVYEKELVTDLELYAIAPSGITYRPWVLDSKNYSLNPKRDFKDNLNNLEQVYINNSELELGLWEVVVKCRTCEDNTEYSISSKSFEIKPLLNNSNESSPFNLSYGLIAYYPLASDAKDYSGNERHGEVFGNLTFTGEAAHFDGIDDYIRTPDNVQGLDEGTFSVTFKVNDFDFLGNNIGSIYDKTKTFESDYLLVGIVKDSADGGYNGYDRKIHNRVGDKVFYSSFKLNDTYFYNLDLVWNSTHKIIYINYNLTNLFSYSGGTNDNNNISYNNFIGVLGNGNITQSVGFFNGEIKNIKIWNRSLSNEEIKLKN